MPPTLRKRSAWNKITSYPGDLILKINEEYEAIDWNRLHTVFSWPIGMMLNVIFFSAKSIAYAGNIPLTSPYSNAGSETETWSKWIIVSLGLERWLTPLMFLLWTISLCNATYYFSKSRTYYLIETDPLNPPKSSNLKQITLSSLIGKKHSSILNFFSKEFWKATGKFATKEEEDKLVWELAAWEISNFHQNLFCLFSPMQVFVLEFMDYSLFSFVILFSLPCLLLFHCQQYNVLLKDRELIFGHVFREYHVKLVNPKIFVKKESVLCSTEPALVFDNLDSSPQKENCIIPHIKLDKELDIQTPKKSSSHPSGTQRSNVFQRKRAPRDQ